MNEAQLETRLRLQQRLNAVRSHSDALGPLDLHAAMSAIRGEADCGGLPALEGLAQLSARLALLPGCRVAMAACLDYADDALGAQTPAEQQAVLAAVVVRLH